MFDKVNVQHTVVDEIENKLIDMNLKRKAREANRLQKYQFGRQPAVQDKNKE